MKINTNFTKFKKKYLEKKNQIIFHKIKCENNKNKITALIPAPLI